jgi:hypothetical protein
MANSQQVVQTPQPSPMLAPGTLLYGLSRGASSGDWEVHIVLSYHAAYSNYELVVENLKEDQKLCAQTMQISRNKLHRVLQITNEEEIDKNEWCNPNLLRTLKQYFAEQREQYLAAQQEPRTITRKRHLPRNW